MDARNAVEMAKVGLLRVEWGVKKDEGEKGADGESVGECTLCFSQGASPD